VWARRPAAADALASSLGAPSFERYEAMLDACDAVAFCVPPAVQAEMAAQAAAAGKALLLEKPIAADVDGAERLAGAVGDAGVASVVVLTFRFSAGVRAFIDEARAVEPLGGRGWFVSGGLLGGHFATPWRLAEGPLLDLGPHVLDLLDAALGPIVSVRAHGARLGWVGLLCDHENGVASEASLCATAAVDPQTAGAAVYGARGTATVEASAETGPDTFATVRADFAAAVAAGPGSSPVDVHRGLHLQRLIAQASVDLGDRG
jgi:predicted dehydrogenase